MRGWVRCAVGLVVAVATGGPTRAGQEGRRFRIDDFEDGDTRVRGELSWIALSGELLGGGARARIQVIAPGGAGSRHALRLDATLAPPGPPFAGAWAPLDPRGRSVDVSGYQGVRLRVRGPARVEIGFRVGSAMSQSNFMAERDAGEDWSVVEVPFTELAPSGPQPDGARWDPRKVGWLGVTLASGTRPGAYGVDIDDVELYGEAAGPAPPAASDGPTVTARFAVERGIPGGATGWRTVGTDPSGDAKQASLPDAVRLLTRAGDDGRAWFRIDLARPVPPTGFGANLVLDVDGDPANGPAWWGTNQAFHFDRLVSAWLLDVGDGFQGVAGIADAGAVMRGEAMGSADVRVALSEDGRVLALGVPRSALGSAGPVRVVAAAGSALAHNDDLPDDGAVVLDPATLGPAP